MTDAIEALRGQLVLLHSLANDTTEANWRDKRLYILQTCVRMLDALAALDAETPATPADVGELVERLRAGPPIRDVEDGSGAWEIDSDTAGKTMREAATALERVVRERDEAREANRKLHRRLQPFEGMFLNFKMSFNSWSNCLFRTQWEHPREANRSHADFLAWAREIDKEYANRRAEAAEAKLAEALADRTAQAERMARLEEALRKAMLWTDEENDVGSWREEAALALSKDNQHG